MTYDFILMNPPYDGNLHLKIVEKAIELLKDDNSICVNLSPVRWLQDPLAKYKKGSDYYKFEESISKHIGKIIVTKAIDASKMFDMLIQFDLGIYVIKKGYTSFDYNSFGYNPIVEKIMNLNVQRGIPYTKYVDRAMNNFFVITAMGSGGKRDKRFDTSVLGNKDYYKVFTDGKLNGKTLEEVKASNPHSTHSFADKMLVVSDENVEKLQKLYDYLDTTIIRYATLSMTNGITLPVNYLPYLSNIENPRTHKMGYESDWTNEDLCNVFGITGFISDTEAEKGSEWETILETMKPYL